MEEICAQIYMLSRESSMTVPDLLSKAPLYHKLSVSDKQSGGVCNSVGSDTAALSRP